MQPDKLQWLAAILATKPDDTKAGLLRVQKIIQLLQYLGMPTDYDGEANYHGWYSFGLTADLYVLESMKYIKLEHNIEIISEKVMLKELEQYQKQLDILWAVDMKILEAASFYAWFIKDGGTREKAEQRLMYKLKKENELTAHQIFNDALNLLKEIGVEL